LLRRSARNATEDVCVVWSCELDVVRIMLGREDFVTWLACWLLRHGCCWERGFFGRLGCFSEVDLDLMLAAYMYGWTVGRLSWSLPVC
jgi:hypothetical protein